MSNGKPWSDEHTATLIRMNAVGYTDAEIAAVTGHEPRTVKVRRQLLGLKAPRRKDWTRRPLAA